MIDVDEVTKDERKDNTSWNNNNKAINGNGKNEEDQNNNRVVDVIVKLPTIIKDIVDSEDEVNDKQRLDACIIAKVITHPFKTFFLISKAPDSVSNCFLNIFNSSLSGPFSNLFVLRLSAFLDSFAIPLLGWSLLVISSNAFLSSSILLFGSSCYFLPGIFFETPSSADSPSLSAFFGFFSSSSSPDLLSTVINYFGKVFKILYWLFY